MIPTSPDDSATSLARRLMLGDPGVAPEEITAAETGADVELLVVVAASTRQDRPLRRARAMGVEDRRDRQLIELADTFLHGDPELFDALVREHLADHPGHLVAAWLAGLPLDRPPSSPETRPATDH
jgi:hypothetical protein